MIIVDRQNHRVLKIQIKPEILIKSGETIGEFKIIGNDDRLDEDDETIIVEVNESVKNANPISIESTTLTILNNSISLVQKDDPFQGLSKSSVSWGDFDNDGDKDVAIMGVNNAGGALIDIYKNDDGSFSSTGQNLLIYMMVIFRGLI